MKLKYKYTLLFFILFFLSFGYGQNIPNTPLGYVTDLADIVDARVENRLNQYLRELEQKTGAQVAVLTINSLEGEAIEDLSLKIAHDKWKLGQKGKDNGALFLIALRDRKYRIEVGYGLEGSLPDSFVGSLARQYLVPYFKKGEYSKGIYITVIGMADKIASDADITISDMPAVKPSYSKSKGSEPGDLLKTVISIIFIIIMIVLFIKKPKLFLMLLLFSSIGGRRGTWGGTGGFGSGGGFIGGGGGFGGGGASGGW